MNMHDLQLVRYLENANLSEGTIEHKCFQLILKQEAEITRLKTYKKNIKNAYRGLVRALKVQKLINSGLLEKKNNLQSTIEELRKSKWKLLMRLLRPQRSIEKTSKSKN